MQDDKFRSGDVVRLQSGGPNMTVMCNHIGNIIEKGYHTHKLVFVVWIADNGQLHQAHFLPEMLIGQ